MNLTTTVNLQKGPLHHFSLKMPTQSASKTLQIHQTPAGLSVSVHSHDKPIESLPIHRIVGLPKLAQIPREFFDVCCAIVAETGDGHKVYFAPRLMGGMFNPSDSDTAIVVPGMPSSVYDIETFYNRNPIVQAQVQRLTNAGTVKLGEIIDYTLFGASSLNIAYLVGRLIPQCGVQLTIAKDQYSRLVTDLTVKFTEMQTNNMMVLQQHLSSVRYASIGQLQGALQELAQAKIYADDNLQKCNELLCAGETMRDSLTSCSLGLESANRDVNKIGQRRQALQSEITTRNDQLKEVRQRITAFQDQELQALRNMNDAEANERTARMINGFTLGFFSFLGGEQILTQKYMPRSSESTADW